MTLITGLIFIMLILKYVFYHLSLKWNMNHTKLKCLHRIFSNKSAIYGLHIVFYDIYSLFYYTRDMRICHQNDNQRIYFLRFSSFLLFCSSWKMSILCTCIHTICINCVFVNASHTCHLKGKKSNTNNIVIFWYSWLKIRMRMTYVCKKKLKSKKEGKKRTCWSCYFTWWCSPVRFYSSSSAYMFAIQ